MTLIFYYPNILLKLVTAFESNYFQIAVQNNLKNIKYLTRMLIGNQSEYTLEHRFFIASSLVGAIAGLLSTTINIFLKFEPALTITTSLIFVIYSSFYYISLKKRIYKSLVLPYIFISLLTLSYSWFINGGSEGPVFYVIVTALIVYIVITKDANRIIAIAVVILTISVLFLWENFQPEIIMGYSDPKTKFFDLYFTAFFCVGLIAFITSYITDNYREERERVIKQRDMIAEQNKEIKLAEQQLMRHKENLEEMVKKRTQELEETNRKLKFAKEKAEESDRLKSAFLSNMSHEIRTPMNAIIGFSSLLNEPGNTPEMVQEYIDIITNKGNLLLNIINDIIDISKVEANEIKIHKSVVDIGEIIEEIYLTYLKIKETRKKNQIGLKLIKPKTAKSIVTYTDANRLKQILSNLVDNAIKFTHQGSIEIGYDEVREAGDAFIKFTVKDTGIGISPDNKELIFSRFRQIDESNTREYGGTGLGLAISKKLVELLGGRVEFKSELGKGSIFIFFIPFERVKDQQTGTININAPDSNYTWMGKKILIVEDNPSSLLLLKNYLLKTNAEIIESTNGKEAVEICSHENNDIDLVLMDIELPEMNGYMATRKIKSINKNLPVIAQTAYAMAEDEIKARAAGCDAYLKKPFSRIDLLTTLSRFLD